MKTFFQILLLTVALANLAFADIWMWKDANGRTHFVDSEKPLYTWTDEHGTVYYSDTPDHEDAVSVDLIWVSGGTLEAADGADDKTGSDGFAYPGESVEQRAAREEAEAYYCKRATEVYDSYVKAPRLYGTNANGERQYLSDKDAENLIAETRARVDEYCN